MASASDPIRLSGRAFPPDSAHETPAELVLDGDEARLIGADGAVLRRLTRADLVAEPALGGTERTIRLPDGAVFLTRDPSVDAAFGHRGSWLPQLEGLGGTRLLVVAALTLVATVGLVRVAVPALVAIAVWMTPAALVRQLDAGTLSAVDFAMAGESRIAASRRAEVEAVFAELRAAAPPAPRGVRDALLFRSFGGLENAFALPGGTVIVSDALVRALEDDPDALAGVLAHEITHTRERHGLEALYRSIGLYALIALLVGDAGPILDEVLLEGNTLLQLSGTRAAEREADAGALPLMRAAGYDPAGLARFLERMAEAHGDGGGWASTHPASSERARAIRDAPR